MSRIANFFIASEENNYCPPVLSFKAFLIYSLTLLLLRILLGTLPASSAGVESETLMTLINQERISRNLATLTTSLPLLDAAREKSQDMIDRDYFAHIDPDGNYVWARIIKHGYTPYRILGENLALDFATSEGMVKAWIDSPTHRANLLHPDFIDQGLGALYGDYQGRYTNLTASLFGALATQIKRSEPPKTQGSQTPPPTPTPPQPLPPSMVEPVPANPEPTARAEIRPQHASGQTNNPAETAARSWNFQNAFTLSRVIFTLFSVALLCVLSVDSVIIYQHDLAMARSHSTYHLFSILLLTLISILIWWW